MKAPVFCTLVTQLVSYLQYSSTQQYYISLYSFNKKFRISSKTVTVDIAGLIPKQLQCYRTCALARDRIQKNLLVCAALLQQTFQLPWGIVLNNKFCIAVCVCDKRQRCWLLCRGGKFQMSYIGIRNQLLNRVTIQF